MAENALLEKVREIISERLSVYQKRENDSRFDAEDCMNWWEAFRHTREAHEILLDKVDELLAAENVLDAK